jgi:DNA-binding phage protein
MNVETILKRTTSFKDDLLKDLADTEFAMYYLEAALADYKEDGNTEALWTALRDVVEAQGGIGKLAERTKVNPQHLNDIFTSEQNPRLDNLQNILSGLGFQIRLEFAEN